MVHIVLSTEARPAKLAPVSRLAAVARTLWGKFHQERRVRSTISQLHRLNDHNLRDIGLERDNIESAIRARFPDR